MKPTSYYMHRHRKMHPSLQTLQVSVVAVVVLIILLEVEALRATETVALPTPRKFVWLISKIKFILLH